MLDQSITFTLSFFSKAVVVIMLEYCPAAQSPKGGDHVLLQYVTVHVGIHGSWGQQIYTVIQAIHSLLYIVTKCLFFSIVTLKYIIKYLQKVRVVLTSV